MTTDPHMDPFDERLRKAMKALDDQVSDRYFEELPTRTLARLEEQMQSDVNRRSGSANPPLTQKPERQEDSGLHDMRALAQSTKQRMSQRRIPTQNPPVDDAALRASSASLRAIALPDPDKMVALDEPPIVGNGTGPSPLLDRAKSEPGVATAAARPSPITPMKRKSKAPLVVASTLVVAAAAGVVGFVVLKKNDGATDTASNAAGAPERSMAERSKQGITVEPAAMTVPATPPPAALESATSAPAPGTATGAAAAAIGGDTITDEAAKAAEGDDAGVKDSKNDRTGKDKDRADERKKGNEKEEVKAPPPGSDKDKDKDKGPVSTDTTPKKEGPADKQEQSLDDLLRSAGEDPNAGKKKDDGPKLDKKALDAGDIRKSMSALNSKAQGCYQKYAVSGNVAVKLQVAPSGDVKSAKVTGSFAGTPTGDCVQSVVNNAKFPPWDGAPTTVNYSYFLTE